MDYESDNKIFFYTSLSNFHAMQQKKAKAYYLCNYKFCNMIFLFSSLANVFVYMYAANHKLTNTNFIEIIVKQLLLMSFACFFSFLASGCKVINWHNDTKFKTHENFERYWSQFGQNIAIIEAAFGIEAVNTTFSDLLNETPDIPNCVKK